MKNKIQIVRIFLPKNKNLESIKGRVGAGDIKISGLSCKDLDLDLKSGNISFENSKISGAVKNKTGSIMLKKSEIKNTNLTTTSGNILVSDCKLMANESMETENGDIKIKIKDPINSFNINAKLNVGNFVLGDVSYRNILDGYQTGKNKKKILNLKTNIGDILFNQNEKEQINEEDFIDGPDEQSSNESSNSNDDNINNKDENN